MGLNSKFTDWLGFGKSKDAAAAKANPTEKPAAKQLRNSIGRGEAVPPLFPQFRATASDQLGAQAGSALARTRMKLLESFTPSQPVSDRKRFAGRSEVLTSIIRALEEQRLHVVVYGERGLGKTSLMHVLTQAARDARYLVVYVSCGADSNFDEIFRTVAAYIPMLFLSTVGPTSPEVEKGKTLAAALPTAIISPRIASDILAKVVGTRIVVVLDEFDRCVSEEFRQNVAELIKNLSDRLVRVQLVIAGVAGNLTELLEHIPSIQRNLFAAQVPWMPASEIAMLIDNGAELCGLSFDEDAGNAVVSAAHGSPYLATLIGHHAGLNALDDLRVRVDIGDVLAAITSASHEFVGRMSGQVRARLKSYARGDTSSLFGIIAGASLLSGGAFRKEDLWSPTVNAEKMRRCEALVAELVSSGILIENKSEAGSVYEFSEDGVAAYLWLLSVEVRLSEKHSPALSSSGDLNHPAAVKLDRTVS